jgi:hypothetical protein
VVTPPTTGATELYDGTSWANNPTGLNTARSWFRQVQELQAAALAFGGNVTGPYSAATEEWTGAGSPLTVTITAS